MMQISWKKEICPKNCYFDFKIKNFHKSKVDGLKKLPTRAHLFYDFLHFRGCPFTKAQFSQGALDEIHFFQLFWHWHISQKALESKLEIAYFFNITFLRIAIVMVIILVKSNVFCNRKYNIIDISTKKSHNLHHDSNNKDKIDKRQHSTKACLLELQWCANEFLH